MPRFHRVLRPYNVEQVHKAFALRVKSAVRRYIDGGAEEGKTVICNEKAFDDIQLLVRRLVDVSRIDTSVELLGRRRSSPILLAPVALFDAVRRDGDTA